MLPDVVDPSLPAIIYLTDLNMLVDVGGRERTRAEFDELCARAGFRLTGVHALPAPSLFSVLEAAPA